MKKILVLFATVVVMMMVTGCENPADVHIPTQEELWMRDGYRYCGVANEVDKDSVSRLLCDFECEYEFTENGKCYVKFPLNEKIVANKEWMPLGDCEWVIGYYFTYHTRLCIFKNGNGLYKLVIEDENNPL